MAAANELASAKSAAADAEKAAAAAAVELAAAKSVVAASEHTAAAAVSELAALKAAGRAAAEAELGECRVAVDDLEAELSKAAVRISLLSEALKFAQERVNSLPDPPAQEVPKDTGPGWDPYSLGSPLQCPAPGARTLEAEEALSRAGQRVSEQAAFDLRGLPGRVALWVQHGGRLSDVDLAVRLLNQPLKGTLPFCIIFLSLGNVWNVTSVALQWHAVQVTARSS